jgi:HK97 family phage portal protein
MASLDLEGHTAAREILPARVYRVQGEGRIEVPGHPVARLLRKPNARQTWPHFLEWLLGSTLLNGNGLAAIEYYGAGRPVALLPIPWSAVQVVALPTGRLAFDLVSYQTPWGSSGQPRRYLDTEVLHLKDRSDDGWLGRSQISRAPDVLGAAIGLQTYSSAIWQNAAMPAGLVTFAGTITPDGKQWAEAFFEDRLAGAPNAKRIFYGDTGTTFTPMSVSPEDAEVLVINCQHRSRCRWHLVAGRGSRVRGIQPAAGCQAYGAGCRRT